jgi:O-antigen ligase
MLLGVIPLATLPTAFVYPDSTPRAAAILLAAAAMPLPGYEIWAGLAKLWVRWEGRAFLILTSIYCASLFLSAACSENALFAEFGTGWRRFGAVQQTAVWLSAVWAACLIAVRADTLKLIFRVAAATGLAVSAYGILQYFGIDPVLHGGQVQFASKYRPSATFGNPTYFANYLLLVIFASVGVVLRDGSRWWRGAGRIAFCASVFALLLTGTRSALLGFVIGAVLLASRSRMRITRSRALVGLLVAAGLCAFIASPAGGRLRDRLSQWVQDPVGGPRLLLWRDSLRMMRSHPLFGSGPDTFAREFPLFQSPELARAYPDFYEESPHNVFLDAAAGQGLAGLVATAGLFFLGIRSRSSLVAAAVVALLVAHQFSVFILPTALASAVWIGAAAGIGSADASAPLWAFPPIVRIAGGALALAGSMIAIQIVHSDMVWRNLLRDLQSGNSASASNYSKTKELWPPLPGLDLWYSRELVQKSGATGPAIEAARRACATSEDRQNAYYNLAVLLAMSHREDLATDAARTAVKLSPNWYKPHWLLAGLLLDTNHPDDAEHEARLGIWLGGAKHPETARMLEAILLARKETE